MGEMFERIKANIFPAAHSAITDWAAFPWHRDAQGNVQTWKPASSQALAIDVFGTIKVSPERDAILAAIARECGVPGDGPWQLELEWTDRENLLREPRPTQVDALACSSKSIVVFECKFTEPGGSCSQPNRITKGAHTGLRQCNGDYAMQINPVNKIESRCALTGKNVAYWDTIPELFGLDASRDYRPCPFRNDAYQWMRNVVLAHRLAREANCSHAVVAAYADGDGLPTAEKVRRGPLGHVPASGARLVFPLSYRAIVKLARSASSRPAQWECLATWIENKIMAVQTNSNASVT